NCCISNSIFLIFCYTYLRLFIYFRRIVYMYTFYVNGVEIKTEKEEKMLPFLRETMGLTSVKNGCSEGACGTCMILVDGKPTKACVLTTAKSDGKQIITVEGLSKREKEVYGYAFAHVGAVQCGFCTPGMVISAKGL